MRIDDWNHGRTLQPLLASALAALTTIIGLMLIAQSSDAILFVDTLQLNKTKSLVDWFPLTHQYTNGYLLWRLDAVSHFALSTFGVANLGFVYLVILAVGTFALSAVVFREEIDIELFRDALLSGGFSVLIGYLFGFDTVVLATVVWVPWHILALYRYVAVQQTSLFEVLCLFGTSVLLSYAANQYAVIALICAFFVTTAFVERINRGRAQTALLISGVPIFFVLFSLTAPDFPSYPEFSHVVPHYGTVTGLYPLIGPELPFPVIDRVFVRSAYCYPALALLIAGIVLLAREHFLREKRSSGIVKLGGGVVVLAISVLLDSYWMNPVFSQIAPLASISRLIPGALLAPLAPLVLALGLLLLLFAVKCIEVRSRSWILISIAFIACLLLPYWRSGASSAPLLRADWGEGVIERVAGSQAGSASPEIIRAVNSPSMYVLRDAGVELLRSRNQIDRLEFDPLSQLPHIIEVSGRPALSANMTDEDPQTRWHMPMKGFEFIKIRFELGIRLRAIRLSVGKLHTDFPRGLKITAYSRCEQSEGQIFYQAKDFQGRLKFSSDGYPVYGGQSDVVAVATEPIDVLCVTIEQTGIDDHFDWSVAEIEIAAGE